MNKVEFILVVFIALVLFFMNVEQYKQIEQLQLKTEELDEHIFILQGDDYNETY